jgi:hypothetical protein
VSSDNSDAVRLPPTRCVEALRVIVTILGSQAVRLASEEILGSIRHIDDGQWQHDMTKR